MCRYIWPDSIDGFDWDKANIEHIARHRVEPAEVEEAFTGQTLLARSWGERYVLFGRSAAGRYLFIAFIVRGGRVRVITARNMSSSERRRFRRN